MNIIENVYSDESINDLLDDIFYAIKDSNIPVGEYGFHKGTFKVTVEWTNDE